MAERKAAEYKRETVGKAALKLYDKAREYNKNDFSYYHIKELVLFGSFTNSYKSRLHDLDVGIEIVKTPYYYYSMENAGFSREDIERAKNFPFTPHPEFEHYCYTQMSSYNLPFILQISFLHEAAMRDIKCRSNIISLHSYNEFEAVEAPEKEIVRIVRNGCIDDTAEHRIKKLSRRIDLSEFISL